jgi:hypothetical protein
MRERLTGLTVLVTIVLIGLFFPFKIPYQIVSIGSVYPSKEWRLLESGGSSVMSTLQDYERGVVDNVASFQFNGGDFSTMKLAHTEGWIQAGDTVLRMYSSLINEQINQLSSEAAIKEAVLNAYGVGEKNPIIQEAANKLRFAKEELTLKERFFSMQKQLFKDSVISKREYLEAENAFALANINVEMSKKALETVGTGQKTESLEIVKNEILALEEKRSYLVNRKAASAVIAPFAGQIRPNILPGQILTLQDVSKVIAQVPVKVETLPYLSINNKISILDVQSQKYFLGTIIKIDNKVEVLDGRRVVLVQAVVEPLPTGERLSIGMSANCRIYCDTINQLEYLKRMLNFRMRI